MAKRTRPTRHIAPQASARPELDSEFANRLLDPFENNYMGVLRTNDPLLLERGNGSVELYRDLKRDGKVFDGLQKRQLALVGKPWQVEPRVKDDAKGTQDAETLTAILKGIAFDRLCSELLEAMLTNWVKRCEKPCGSCAHRRSCRKTRTVLKPNQRAAPSSALMRPGS